MTFLDPESIMDSERDEQRSAARFELPADRDLPTPEDCWLDEQESAEYLAQLRDAGRRS